VGREDGTSRQLMEGSYLNIRMRISRREQVVKDRRFTAKGERGRQEALKTNGSGKRGDEELDPSTSETGSGSCT